MPFRLKSRIKRWLYGSCPGFSGSFPYCGVRTYFPRNSLVFAIACDHGLYEWDNVRLLFSSLRKNATAFDVGANIGLMAIPLLEREPTLSVISVEPSPHNYESLIRTAKESSYHSRWEIVTKALSDHTGETEFHCSAPGLGAYDGLTVTGRSGPMTTIRVPLATLDEVWRGKGQPSTCAIKIDVEGAELQVLRGAAGCIKSERPLILVEWNETNLNGFGCPAEALLDFANESGYDVFAAPNLVRVASPSHLRALMQFGESFALLPRS